MKRILMTGGGTAGHVLPNIALMPGLRARGWELHYAGTAQGIERTLVAQEKDVAYHVIESGKLRRYFSLANFTDPFRVLRGLFQSRALVKSLQPDVVFSKGGFVSVPVALGARGRAPVVIHESDYTPGLANKLSMAAADKVLYTFEDSFAKKKKGGKYIWTGVPLRASLWAGDAARGRQLMGFDGSRPILLVMGGSLGAQAVNSAALAVLSELLARFDVVHLCGRGKVDGSVKRPGYKAFEYLGETMGDVLAAADIVVSRAGANTVFELIAARKPALLIPLPRSQSRGDQIVNADYCRRKGFAVVLAQEDLTPQTMLAALDALSQDKETYIAAMAAYPNADGTNAVLEQIEKARRG